MKSRTTTPPPPPKPEPEYPCLMVADPSTITYETHYRIHPDGPVIVLFTSEGRGVVVARPGSMECLGDSDTKWAMDCFEPYHGEVILSND